MAISVEWDAFRSMVEWQVQRSHRYWEPFLIGIIDTNLLFREHLPVALHETLRGCDLMCRASDDKVYVFCLNTSPDATEGFSNRLWRHLCRLAPGGGELFVGVAGYPSNGTNIDVLLDAATNHLEQSRLISANPHMSFTASVATSDGPSSRILIVDDDPQNRKLLRGSLSAPDRQIIEAADGSDALSLAQETEFDLVLLDVMMPRVNGFEVCRQLKSVPTTCQVPVILITALDDIESRIKGIHAGADDFITKPFFVEEVVARAASLIRLKKALGRMSSLEDVLASLVSAIEAKDSYTKGHTDRVGRLALALGERLGLSVEEREGLRVGGMLHDVGKIGIPEAILNKEGPLTEEEWEVMRTHPLIGVQICAPLAATLGHSLDIIRHHHEKLDGSSYPDKLSGDQISLVARIMAAADIFDALTSDRPYRKGMSIEMACSILREEAHSGKLDVSVVEHLIEVVQTGNGEESCPSA